MYPLYYLSKLVWNSSFLYFAPYATVGNIGLLARIIGITMTMQLDTYVMAMKFRCKNRALVTGNMIKKHGDKYYWMNALKLASTISIVFDFELYWSSNKVPPYISGWNPARLHNPEKINAIFYKLVSPLLNYFFKYICFLIHIHPNEIWFLW